MDGHRQPGIFGELFPITIASLSKGAQFEIVKALWPEVGQYESFDTSTYVSFFQYLGKQTDNLRYHERHFAVQTLDSMLAVVRTLRENTAKSQAELAQTLSLEYINAHPMAVRRSMELTVRLWLTLNVNSPAVAIGPTFADETPLDWDTAQSLEALIKAQYSKSISTKGKLPRSKIDPSLTAAYLASTCGLKLRWTDSLTDHLRFNSRSQTLAVYKHKICLVNHIQSQGGCPIPKAVLNEILDTLNLLFPFGDVATKQLLIKESQQPLYQLGSCGRARNLDLNHYEYFREELEYLIESFNQPPRTWRQLAMDRRNKMEWTLFWVTVMVAVLTAVSIPCNIIQATYSVKAYREQLKRP